ncbi:hemicentin-1 [Anastrepha obliqua]|uniref:hemicentin-1 n=1 Tax=Anastrepha obliqua TaxID=95512 RepID=UPI002409C282|nr:hemicentin-1 [Anastrepha obliqua]
MSRRYFNLNESKDVEEVVNLLVADDDDPTMEDECGEESDVASDDEVEERGENSETEQDDETDLDDENSGDIHFFLGKDKINGEILRVLVNTSAQIKCDVGSSLPDDKVLLVVWYKNNLPIYSYDTRGAHAGTPSHWRDEEVLEDRAVFRTHKEPAELIINPVKEKDAGNFRCRVDFKLSQTRNSNVNLEVVVPPQQPTIFNERHLRIESRAGPYEEGGSLEVTCVVYGGSPPPTVTWLMNGQIQNSVVDYSYEGNINSKLVVRNLSRIHQHAVYTCQASNFHKKYVATNITIELYLRPLLVEISFNNQPMSADRKYEIECQAIGSRPPAKITWWMGNMELHGHSQKVSEDGNVSLSVLSITPTREDHGKALSCRATNELVRNGIRETAMKLNVFFIPTLQLDLGSNLNPEDIEEGDDVYFECKVHANPAAYKVVWKHNNQIIQHNQRAGVIVSSGDLALQGVTRHQAGNYTCTASNVEGDGDSNVVELKVMYKPICRPDQKKIYGVARNEAAEILCEVDAFPPPENFKWSFNNTAETFDMPQSGFRAHSAQGSTLTYTPVKELDFGTIMCWADNNVGQQKEPCVFHLIAAGKPEIPANCTIFNQTSDSLEVYCVEGFDGGLRQWFLMEIFDQHSGQLQANISSKYPVLSVTGLDSGRLFRIFVYAVNLRGRSEAVQVEGYTLKAAEKQTVALTSYKGTQSSFELTPILSVGIFVGILVALVCIAIGTIAALKLRSHKQQQKYQHQNAKFSRPGNLQIKDKISLPLSHSEEMYDEKNPDVVPYNEVDGEYKQKSATQTPSGHLSTTSEAEISCKPSTDELGMYQSNKDDELHYAELSLAPGSVAIGSASSTGLPKKSISVDCSSSMLLQGAGINTNNMSVTIGGTLPHGSSVRKLLPSIPANAGASTLQRHKPQAAVQQPPPPPSYDYFEEPTIYAQIDHYKSTSTGGTATAATASTNGGCSSSASVSPFPPCISSPASQGTPSTVSPGTVQMYTLPSHPGGYHTLPHNHHHQQQQQQQQQLIQQQQLSHQQHQQQQQQQTHNTSASSMLQMMAAAAVVQGSAGNIYHHHGTLPMPPTYQQHQQQQLQQQQATGQMLVSSNSSGLGSATTTAAVTSPSSSLSGLSAIGKSYSREIVTVRTPLMYSQQESCV